MMVTKPFGTLCCYAKKPWKKISHDEMSVVDCMAPRQYYSGSEIKNKPTQWPVQHEFS